MSAEDYVDLGNTGYRRSFIGSLVISGILAISGILSMLPTGRFIVGGDL